MWAVNCLTLYGQQTQASLFYKWEKKVNFVFEKLCLDTINLQQEILKEA